FLQHDARLAAGLVEDLAQAPAHRRVHAQPDGLAEGLLGREARGPVTQAAPRPAGAAGAPDGQFRIAQDAQREALALPPEGRLDAADVAQVGAAAVAQPPAPPKACSPPP